MIEGQMGLDWSRWRSIAHLTEELGFAGLYRSDHFLDPGAPTDDSLELIAALTHLAAASERLTFGAMVAPVSFREPVMYARQGAALASLSGGRYRHGLGAGWMEREHEAYGFDLGDVRTRLDRFAEALEITRLLLRSDEPVSFDGRFYRLLDAPPASPRPSEPVPICIGGKGPARTLPLVARYADVWNGSVLTADAFRDTSTRLDELLATEGRAPSSLRRTIMTGIYFGRDSAALDERLRRLRAQPHLADVSSSELVAMLNDAGMIAGTTDDVREQLAARAEAGCDEVMLQWLWLDDLDGIAELAEVTLERTS